MSQAGMPPDYKYQCGAGLCTHEGNPTARCGALAIIVYDSGGGMIPPQGSSKRGRKAFFGGLEIAPCWEQRDATLGPGLLGMYPMNLRRDSHLECRLALECFLVNPVSQF